jgi:hypothetical protein
MSERISRERKLGKPNKNQGKWEAGKRESKTLR